jgi:glycosyltransferase involved in cell wall biosynthesis
MVPVSVVIICLNAANTIEKVIKAALLLTDDVIILDTGSTDGTQDKIPHGAKLINSKWLGFGATKNEGARLAKYNWILSLDSDEVLSKDLIASIQAIDFSNNNAVYKIKLINYFGDQPISFGQWKNNWVMRLFHKDVAKWDQALVHEKLSFDEHVQIKKLKGVLHHFTTTGFEAYYKKLQAYSNLMAEKYYVNGKKSSRLKIYLAPAFNFIKNYVFQLGILDKKAGWDIAKAYALYTYMKYKKLHQLHQEKNKDD